MSLLDLLKQEYVKGKVIDKYRLNNGNVGLVVEQAGTGRRYNVRFRDDYKGACVENLFGLLNDPFSCKTEHVDRLVNAGDSIELTMSYSKDPFREAYRIHSVSRLNPGSVHYKNPPRLINLPERSVNTARY